MISAIRKQWRDYHEVTTNDDPIKRWAWPSQPKDWKNHRWLQADIWVTPGRIVGIDVERDPWSDSSSAGQSYRLTITVAFLSLVLSIESYHERGAA